jgi:hypothetical protein
MGTQSRKFAAWLVGTVAAVVSFAAAVAVFLPRVTVEAERVVDLSNSFPTSITVTNGLVPLDEVQVAFRPCQMIFENLKVVGRKDCSGTSKDRNFELQDYTQQPHHLQMDEKWTIVPPARIVQGNKLVSSDISVIVKFWPWLVPRFWFKRRETEFRFQTAKQPDGQLVWISTPVD